jgi:hypothetical protein
MRAMRAAIKWGYTVPPRFALIAGATLRGYASHRRTIRSHESGRACSHARGLVRGRSSHNEGRLAPYQTCCPLIGGQTGRSRAFSRAGCRGIRIRTAIAVVIPLLSHSGTPCRNPGASRCPRPAPVAPGPGRPIGPPAPKIWRNSCSLPPMQNRTRGIPRDSGPRSRRRGQIAGVARGRAERELRAGERGERRRACCVGKTRGRMGVWRHT